MQGTAQLGQYCGINVQPSIAFGAVVAGVLSQELQTTIYTGDSTVDGITIAAQATDWTGTNTKATGTATISSVQAGDTLVIGSITYTAVLINETLLSPTATNAEYHVGVDDDATARNIVSAVSSIDNSIRSGASGNVVTITASTTGIGGNAIALTSGQNTIAVSGSGTLEGGSEGQVHLAADVTKFSVDVASTGNPGIDYASKTSMDSTSVDLTNVASPANDVDLYLQISTIATLQNMPYDGELTQTLTFTVDCN